MISSGPRGPAHVPPRNEAVEPPQSLCVSLGLLPTMLNENVTVVFDHFVQQNGRYVAFACRTRHAQCYQESSRPWVQLTADDGFTVGWVLPEDDPGMRV